MLESIEIYRVLNSAARIGVRAVAQTSINRPTNVLRLLSLEEGLSNLDGNPSPTLASVIMLLIIAPSQSTNLSPF